VGVNPDEEARAVAFRAALNKAPANLLARALRLKGSETAAQRVRNSWQPWVDWLRERSD
jgi:hypothetical protein